MFITSLFLFCLLILSSLDFITVEFLHELLSIRRKYSQNFICIRKINSQILQLTSADRVREFLVKPRVILVDKI